VEYHFLENHVYRNGIYAKNRSLRAAKGDIVIQQSADVMHADPDAIKRLVGELTRETLTFATVQNWNIDTCFIDSFQLVGPLNIRPLFFLGACWREDLCAIGGYDEEFARANTIWYDDDWHGDCLTKDSEEGRFT